MKKPKALLIAGSVILLAGAGDAVADGLRRPDQFFGKGQVEEYTGPIQLTSFDDEIITVLPPSKRKEREARLKKEAEAEKALAASMVPADEKKTPTPAKKVYETSEEILAEFGDPDAAPTVNPPDTAPAPIRAAHAAMNRGDLQLATKYIAQGAKYFETVRERASDFAYIQTMAEEIYAGRDPKVAITTDEQKELYDRIKSTLEKIADDQKKPAMTDEALALLEKARKEATEKAPELDEDGEIDIRKQTRKELAAKLPKDPRGLVDVYFFFEPKNDDQLRLMLGRIEQLKVNNSKDRSVTVEAFSTLDLKREESQSIKDAFKLSMPVLNGRAVAAQLGIKGFPAVVFVTGTTRQTHVEQGYPAYERLDEIIRLMHG